METMDVYTDKCLVCGHTGLIKNVPVDGFNKWKAGMFIQDALAVLPADEREQIMTGTHPACWEIMCPEDEDDEIYHDEPPF